MKKALFDSNTKLFLSLVRADVEVGNNYVLVSEEIGQTLTNRHKLVNEDWILVGPSNSELWGSVRSQRDMLLAQSDWTQLPDVTITTKEAWATYRQALRDITDQPDPLNIVWPTPPA